MGSGPVTTARAAHHEEHSGSHCSPPSRNSLGSGRRLGKWSFQLEMKRSSVVPTTLMHSLAKDRTMDTTLMLLVAVRSSTSASLLKTTKPTSLSLQNGLSSAPTRPCLTSKL